MAPCLGWRAIASCRLSRMSLHTCCFSTCESCPGSTQGLEVFIWAPRMAETNGGVPTRPTAPTSLPPASPDLLHPPPAHRHKWGLETATTTFLCRALLLGKKPPPSASSTPNEMRCKKQ